MSKETTAIERQIVRKLIRSLRAADYLVSQVWDGGEYQNVRTEKQVIDAVFSVDTATIHFDLGINGNNEEHSHGVFIVCGNGFDCLSDWHIGDRRFDEVVTGVSDMITQMEGYK